MILHWADTLLPSVDVAVIIALPTLRALTLPFLSTVATFVLLDFQVKLLLVAFIGKAVAFKVVDLPL